MTWCHVVGVIVVVHHGEGGRARRAPVSAHQLGVGRELTGKRLLDEVRIARLREWTSQ